MYVLEPYDNALQEVLDFGVERTNKRTGIKTLSVFGILKRYKLDTDYFPIITRRKVWPKSVFAELLWLLSGSTSNKDLKKLGCNFWAPWLSEEFEKRNGFEAETFGPVYGFALRHFGGKYNKGIHNEGYGFGGFDQLTYLINRIKSDPSCRRIMWSLWNPHSIDSSRLPPCHWAYQAMIDDSHYLTGMLIMRSCDAPIGCGANIQAYAALTKMIAQQTNTIARELVYVCGDFHIYWDQIEKVKEYLTLPIINSPKLEIRQAKDICSYSPDDFILTDFNSGPKLDIPVAV